MFGFGIPVLTLFSASESTIRKATRLWARGVLLGLRLVVGLDYVERGREYLPKNPCLIVCNHQSTWETIAFLLLVPDVAIIAKHELLRIPVLSWYLKRSPMIIIDRESGLRALKAMIDESRAALSQGRSVLIFPEGTRGGEADQLTFRRGVGLLYSKLNATVLPVAVDSGNFWSRKIKRPGSITVSYLPPIGPGLPAAEFIQMAEALIEAENYSN